jgi:hypothetical protein
LGRVAVVFRTKRGKKDEIGDQVGAQKLYSWGQEITKNRVYSNLRLRNSELLLNEFNHFLGKPGSVTSSLCCIPIRAMDSSLLKTFKPISDKTKDFLTTR